jgi:ABC-type phosphonate transport system ATPase subunit
VGAFSGGMRRRLSLAISLIGDPRAVYLDEPSTVRSDGDRLGQHLIAMDVRPAGQAP